MVTVRRALLCGSAWAGTGAGLSVAILTVVGFVHALMPMAEPHELSYGARFTFACVFLMGAPFLLALLCVVPTIATAVLVSSLSRFRPRSLLARVAMVIGAVTSVGGTLYHLSGVAILREFLLAFEVPETLHGEVVLVAFGMVLLAPVLIRRRRLRALRWLS